MKVLVTDCGSSSLKYQLVNMENESVLAKGLCERIGINGSLLTHTPTGGEKYEVETVMPSHREAIELIIQALIDPSHGTIKNTDEIPAIGHCMVHGGTYYSGPVLVNENAKKAIADCFDLAPPHNSANLMGIETCEAAVPGKLNVAVFDTTFGISVSEKTYLYALPCEYYEKYKVCRYGFHGTSHNPVTGEVIREGGLGPKSVKVVVYHLGNGASVSASIGDRYVDTSMSLTPLEGLIIGTRSGDINPAVIQFIHEHEKLTVEEVTDVLNKKSGVLGLNNDISSDFRNIDGAANGDNHLARVALEAYTLHVTKYIDAYVATVNSVDTITFTAGVGENDKFMRKNICAYLGYSGVKVDNERDNVRGEERLISIDDSKVQVYLLPTNKELVIAKDTLKLTK